MAAPAKKLIFSDIETFESAFEYAAIGMALVSPTGEWVRVNGSLCEMLGYSAGELLQKTFQDITHPDDLLTDLNFVNEMLEGRRRTYQMEKRYFRKDGATLWVLLSVSLVRDLQGAPKHFVSQIQDITLLKERTSALEVSESRAKLVTENSHDGFWDWYIQKDYEYMSPRFWEILGFTPEEKRHHPSEWQALIFEEDLPPVLEAFDKHVKTRGESPFSNRVRYRHKDGSTVHIFCKGRVIEWDEDGQPVRMVGSHTDITELVQAEISLAQNAKMVALGEMAGGVAHEINNPLAILTLAIDSLSRRVKQGKATPEELLTSLEKMHGTVERITSIINALKRVSRDESLDNLMPDSIGSILADCLELSRERLKSFGIDLRIKVGAGEDSLICHGISVSQILLNLLNNAFQAVRGQPDPWVGVETVFDANRVQIRVSNSGAPIPKDIRERLMEPFFTTKDPADGTGLGLSVALSLAQSHGGDLELDATADTPCFVLTLPKRPTNP